MTTSSDMYTPIEERILDNGPVWHGTAIGWEKSIDSKITQLPILNERFCGFKYTDIQSGFSILAFTAYLPTCGQDDAFLETLSQLSNDISSHRDTKDILIVGLDSNESTNSTRRRSDGMKNFKQQFSLQTVLNNEIPTFHHQNQTSESQIDHILYSKPADSDVDVNLQELLCLLENPHNLSSHNVLIGELRLPVRKVENNERDLSHLYTKFSVNKPVWNEAGFSRYRNDVCNTLTYLLDEFNEVEHCPVISELVSNALVFSAENSFETVRTSKLKTTNKTTQKKPHFSEAHKIAYSNHRNICADWRNQGRPSDPNHPARKAKLLSQRNLQRISREENASKAKQFNESLMQSFYGNINELYKILRFNRGQSSKSVDIPFIETLDGTYSGQNILEGFCRNTELLCTSPAAGDESAFAKLCKIDNMVIFDLSKEDDINEIPAMTLTELKHIIFKRLKLNKACDIFKLTTEHLRFCGDEALSLILLVINAIIRNLNYMSSTQLNTAVATIIYKGKNKQITNHKSYRQVRVSPLIGRIIDEYLRPNIIDISKSIQNSSQYGFTSNITYMMAALQRHEAEKYCIDQKKTFFGCSLDGESAFEVVNRSIQTREL